MRTYVPGFDFDIFISYSQANDFEKWVSKFHEKLEARLKERVPPGTNIFRDGESIQGNKELTPRILSGIRNSAVLVPIISRSYITRPWCIKECEEFLAFNLSRGIDGRIFPVRYDDVSPNDYQKFVGERLGYEFFSKTVEGKFKDTLAPDSGAFKKKLNILRMEIGTMLEQMKTAMSASQTEAGSGLQVAKEPGSAPTIFVSEAAPGLSDQVDQLTLFLRGLGYKVVQPGGRFYDVKDFEKFFVDLLNGSQLFVQLLGRKFDPHPDRFLSWDRWQLDRAEQIGLPRLRWFNKFDLDGKSLDLKNLDSDHREFVTQRGVWDCDLQRFFEIVRGHAEKLSYKLQQKGRVGAQSGPKPWIVLRSDKCDRDFTEHQIGLTLKQLQCEWLQIPDKDIVSLDVFARDFPAEGLLVVYRTCPNKWVLVQLQELRKFLKTEHGRRWTCGLWRAPANDEEALSCSVDGLFVIEPPNRQDIEDFVTHLRAGLDADEL